MQKKEKKRRLPITRDVHKSHLIKHKSLSPWNQSAESHLKTEVRESVFLVARNIHRKEATISFMFASPSNKLSAKYTGTKGWTVILPSLGHITIHQPFQNILLLCYLSPELKKIKTIPTMLKRINKRIEKENGHKHRGFYSECHNVDESTECTWRAKLKEAEDNRAHRVIRWVQRALSIFRPRDHLSPQHLLEF